MAHLSQRLSPSASSNTLAKLEEHSCEHVRLFDSDVDALVKLWPEEATRILEPWDVVYTLYRNSEDEEVDDHKDCTCVYCTVDEDVLEAYLAGG